MAKKTGNKVVKYIFLCGLYYVTVTLWVMKRYFLHLVWFMHHSINHFHSNFKRVFFFDPLESFFISVVLKKDL